MIFFAPNNFKKGRLIANKYRIIDILIASIILLIMIPIMINSLLGNNVNFWTFFIALTISILAFFFIQPFNI